MSRSKKWHKKWQYASLTFDSKENAAKYASKCEFKHKVHGKTVEMFVPSNDGWWKEGV